jgi:hypothetical protein
MKPGNRSMRNAGKYGANSSRIGAILEDERDKSDKVSLCTSVCRGFFHA